MPKRKRSPRKKPLKHYTFVLRGAFEVQQTFTSDEVRHVPTAGKFGFVPTDSALEEFEDDLKSLLFEGSGLVTLQISTSPRLLIAVAQDELPGDTIYFNENWASHLKFKSAWPEKKSKPFAREVQRYLKALSADAVAQSRRRAPRRRR